MQSGGHGGGGGFASSGSGGGGHWDNGGGHSHHGGGGWYHGYRSRRGGCCAGLCCLFIVAVIACIFVPIYLWSSHDCITEAAAKLAPETLCRPGSSGSVKVKSEPAGAISYLLPGEPRSIPPTNETVAIRFTDPISVGGNEWKDVYWFLPSESLIEYVVWSSFKIDFLILSKDNYQKYKEDRDYQYARFSTGTLAQGFLYVPASDDWHLLVNNDYSYDRITVSTNFTIRPATFDLGGQLNSCNNRECSFSLASGQSVVTVVPSGSRPKLSVRNSFSKGVKFGALGGLIAAAVVLGCLSFVVMIVIYKASRAAYSAF